MGRDLDRTAIVSGFLFIILGIMFLLARAGVVTLHAAFVWPMVLIALGVAILVGGRHRRWMIDGFDGSAPPEADESVAKRVEPEEPGVE